MRKKLYGNAVTPACGICQNGRRSSDGDVILCYHRGVVDPSARCRKFVYDPLRRVPYIQPALGSYTEEDFKLD